MIHQQTKLTGSLWIRNDPRRLRRRHDLRAPFTSMTQNAMKTQEVAAGLGGSRSTESRNTSSEAIHSQNTSVSAVSSVSRQSGCSLNI
ncbi:hypothetical protein FOXG_11224 [Fusarium oxysporum f. sp. lycopersici 4287]|uniref:Uncharacterized protein n=2 Tax=Fusarium oxysporum TaxID=5507 RepID=A0A0J9WQR7_FUSO4|nr:hypothetical protein FOXG_11224 [Fusarium oxysporum f. sp. lycopersici 4287]EXK46872.1 hypothetical protein FOMG_00489 [Fusarium oxysporum f. sp. melonis 26406]KNB11252.1 hypothetical protein FOXG_11224 [Fusarium oxysporum f. sp. lycopersici 4287]